MKRRILFSGVLAPAAPSSRPGANINESENQ